MSFEHRHPLEQRLSARDSRRGDTHLAVARRTTAVSVLSERGAEAEVVAALAPLCALRPVGPGEWLATDAESASPGLARTLSAAAEGRAVVLDQGEGRVAFRLEGPAARAILARLTAVDTDPAAFPPGAATQTGLAEISVNLACTGADSFEILAPSSFAGWIFDELMLAGRAFGLTASFA